MSFDNAGVFLLAATIKGAPSVKQYEHLMGTKTQHTPQSYVILPLFLFQGLAYIYLFMLGLGYSILIFSSSRICFALLEFVETAVFSSSVESQRQVDAIEQIEPVGRFAAVAASTGFARGTRRSCATGSRLCRLRAQFPANYLPS